jgi:hypothetical protein
MDKKWTVSDLPLMLIGSEAEDGVPVISEGFLPDGSEHGDWRPATDEEYAAYVAYWDAQPE